MDNTFYDFKGKRFTTIVHTRSVSNVVTGERVNYAHKYGVYDNETQTDVIIIGFKPTCYEDIKKKAIELNSKN